MAHRQNVLIADSSKYFALPLWRTLLPEPEFEVIGVAKNIAQAVEMTVLHHPAIILIDTTAPHMGGVWAIKRLRELHRPSVIIAVTSLWSKEYAQAASTAGAADCLVKSEIVNKLPQHLDKLVRSPLTMANIY
jgi:two-component system chemotaxis response regulator CheY